MEIELGRSHQTSLFRGCNRCERRDEAGVGAVAHLNEDERSKIHHDPVYFAHAAGEVARDDLQTGSLKVILRQTLIAGTVVPCAHPGTLRVEVPASLAHRPQT